MIIGCTNPQQSFRGLGQIIRWSGRGAMIAVAGAVLFPTVAFIGTPRQVKFSVGETASVTNVVGKLVDLRLAASVIGTLTVTAKSPQQITFTVLEQS